MTKKEIIKFEKIIDRNINGINILIAKMPDESLRLLHFHTREFDDAFIENEPEDIRWHTLTEIQASGCDLDDHHGGKHCQSQFWNKTAPVYVSHNWLHTETGEKLELNLATENIHVCHHFQFIGDLPLMETWTSIKNNGKKPLKVEYIASFCLHGLTKESTDKSWGENSQIMIPHSGWRVESQWRTYRPDELGLTDIESVPFSTKRIINSNTGTWTSKEYMPMGIFSNIDCNSHLFWEIATPGSWTWEISNLNKQLYLRLAGPSERENLWFKKLNTGELFSSESVLVGIIEGAVEETFSVLNKGRRIIRRKNSDNENLPVIFNDYMNCLFADPTTEKELPLIKRAAELGAEYYVIDAGWYDDGPWWDGVGKWQPVESRFPNGIEELMLYIKELNMIPGLWLEIERMGIKCPLAKEWPDECFFMRNGERVIEHSSYQLDFRHPIVLEHVNEVVRRLVEDYGVGFIKMDYNIEAGPGTEIDADSFGDGLLLHQQAYIAWIDHLFAKYPELVIEHCSSGGLRMSYAYMRRHSVCSTTDNESYLSNAVISVNSVSCVCPEQAGVWVYPISDDREEIAMNLINGMLWRMYLSGQVMKLKKESLALIKQAVAIYKEMRTFISQADPIWPLGLGDFRNSNAVFGLKNSNTIYLAVWQFKGSCTINIPLETYGEISMVNLHFPLDFPCKIVHDSKSITLDLLEKTARLLKITLK